DDKKTAMKRTIIIRDADTPTGVATPIAKPDGPLTPSRHLTAIPSAVDPARERSHVVRSVLTVLCALTADGMQWLIPFLWPVWDGAMVLAILVLWGWRWEILIVVIPELIPGLELAPTWTIFAAYLVIARRKDPR
ncbi:MAG: hypothetical protein ABI222_17270, partial [Opitutaceae bacterium]